MNKIAQDAKLKYLLGLYALQYDMELFVDHVV